MRILPLALVVFLCAGCAAPETGSSPGSEPEGMEEWPNRVMADCVSPAFLVEPVPCFEPTITSDHLGRLFVATGRGDRLVLSEDGGKSWQNRTPAPTAPGTPEGAAPGDVVVQTDELGRLWWSAILYDPSATIGQYFGGLQVARSDDRGVTWAMNQYLDVSGELAGASYEDRQFLAAWDGGAALAFWAVEVGTWISVSENDGATWSAFELAMPMAPRANILSQGPMVRGADGALYFAYAAGTGVGTVRVARWSPGDLIASESVVAELGVNGLYKWPVLAADPAGGLVAAWTWSANGEVLVASSADGVEWSPATPWNAGAPSDEPPGLAVTDDTVAVSWYTTDNGHAWALGAAADKPGDVQLLAEGLGSGRLTDFAVVTAWPQGAATAWVHQTNGVFVAVAASG